MLVNQLEPATSYYFRLIASNKQGPSIPSKNVSVKTPDGLPTKSGQPKFDLPTPNSIKVLWSASSSIMTKKQGKDQ